MAKALQDLFAVPPPTTYEIEAYNLKPPNYVNPVKDQSKEDTSIDNLNGVEAASTNKRKERSFDNTDEIPFKKPVIAETSTDPVHAVVGKTESAEVTLPQQHLSNPLETETPINTESSVVNSPNTTTTTSTTPDSVKFVSPLDIILGTANIEKLNAAVERVVPSPKIPFLQLNSPSPIAATPSPPLSAASSTNNNQKRRTAEYNKIKRREKKRAESDHLASLNHADRPSEEVQEKDENDLFSEFEELKARKEKQQQQELKKKKNQNKKKNNNNQGNKSNHGNGNHQANKNYQNNLQNNQHLRTVSNDTLPNFHLPNERNPHQQPFVPRKVCIYFAKGHCNAGDKCTFKHERPANLPAPPPSIPFTQKIVCQFFKTGACAQFENCKFSHDLKIEPCRFYHMSGACEQGDACPYSHEPLNDDRLKRLRTLTGPCRFYHFKGYCNNPDTCMFSHDEATADQLKDVESTIMPCRFYHILKNCGKGDDCFYAHSEATPLQVQQLREAEKKNYSSQKKKNPQKNQKK